jgi:uncharacterized repeat protein (TIGR02543 family)
MKKNKKKRKILIGVAAFALLLSQCVENPFLVHLLDEPEDSKPDTAEPAEPTPPPPPTPPPGTVATPTATPPSGTYPGPQTVTLSSATTGAVVYYTLDGLNPATGGNRYINDLTVETGTTLKAIAKKDGMIDSGILTAVYTQAGTVAAPTATPAGDAFTENPSVTLATGTGGADIYYTIGGAIPTTGSTKYENPFTVTVSDAGTALKAIAVKDGLADSAIMTETYYKAYTVTFDTGGGEPEASAQIIKSGENAVLPVTGPAKDGFTFDGWYTVATGGAAFDFTSAITADITVWAQWTEVFTVTFNANGGTPATATATTTSGGTVSLPSTNPTRVGYTFNSWNTEQGGGTEFDSTTEVTASITVWAQWTQNPYTVTFNANGGTPAMATADTAVGGGTVTLPEAPVMAGYVFGGWYTAQNGGGTVFNDTTVVSSNITVYAKWTITSNTVTFDSDGGSAVPSQTVAYGTMVAYPMEPSCASKFFGGWFNENSCSTPYNYGTPVTAPVTIYAKWLTEGEMISEDLGASPDNTFDVYDLTTWNAAKTAINSGGAGNYVIKITGSFSLAGVSASTFTAANIKVLIYGDGDQTISLSSNGYLLYIGANQSFVLRNITLQGQGTSVSNTSALVYTDYTTSKLNMRSGAVITANYHASNNCGGVYVYGGGTFIMSGGTVRDNAAGSGGGGGGVYVSTSSTFTMSGGTISGNTSYEGTVYVSSGTFTMSGGTISGNTAGGGVKVSSGTFTMSGGTISGNNGVAVYIYGSNGVFTMNGGAVSGNTGRGVYVYNSGTFTMNNGTVGGNTSGGVYLTGGTFKMNGGAISGNTATTNGGGVYVDRVSGSTFNKTSGVIFANTASSAGNQVYCNAGKTKTTASGAENVLYARCNGSAWSYTTPGAVNTTANWD